MADEAAAATNDALLSLAFSLHSNPGAYALLLGAGASYSSGIPTAWGVLTDLCRKVAMLESVDLGDEDPAGWYERTKDEVPTYGKLLAKLAQTPALRQALLEQYFEVTEEEREAGTKLPTPAHQAIARLATAGAVKVIMTLNFDRLIEQALRAVGIEPTVITNPSDVAGMRPLHQLDCCVIHLHGDYKSPDSMLNTDEELASYAPATQQLLDRIVDDYGLITAGWSATYDPALREAIQARHNVARYPLAWIEPFDLTEDGRHLVTSKAGTVLATTADDAFARLADAVDALQARDAPHPLTVPVAIATAKRELSGRTVAVGVHDTLNKAFADLHRHPDFGYLQSHEEAAAGGFEAIVHRIEESTRLPAALAATLAYWGTDDTDNWWLPELERFAYRRQGVPGSSASTRLLEVRRVAGLQLFYAAGVAATAAGRWKLLRRIFDIQVPHLNYNQERQRLAEFNDPPTSTAAARLATRFSCTTTSARCWAMRSASTQQRSRRHGRHSRPPVWRQSSSRTHGSSSCEASSKQDSPRSWQPRTHTKR